MPSESPKTGLSGVPEIWSRWTPWTFRRHLQEQRKQFTARDMVSRWDVIEAHTRATSSLAARFLRHPAKGVSLRHQGHPGRRRRLSSPVNSSRSAKPGASGSSHFPHAALSSTAESNGHRERIARSTTSAAISRRRSRITTPTSSGGRTPTTPCAPTKP